MTDHELHRVIEMANQIAANFSFHADGEERIADHVTRFWAPSMRKLLIEHAGQGGERLDSLVMAAVRRLGIG